MSDRADPGLSPWTTATCTASAVPAEGDAVLLLRARLDLAPQRGLEPRGTLVAGQRWHQRHQGIGNCTIGTFVAARMAVNLAPMSSRLRSAVLRGLLPAATLVALGGCGSLPPLHTLSCASADRATIAVSPAGERSTSLDVLTYNIEGLQWPARGGRAGSLRAIGAALRTMREAGRAPDVVLFQEVFSPAATRAVIDAGFPAIASGPSRTRRSVYTEAGKLPGRGRLMKGELGFRLATSGLVVASRYPIMAVRSDPYSRRACAGFDCLSNKGMMLATIVVPGVPEPIDIVNTHMNARRASKVAPARHLAAHRAQARQLEAFLTARNDPSRPMILGGDFNMRRSPERFEEFRLRHPLGLVHQYCLHKPACDVRMSWDGDAPWLDTQDLQFFRSGSRIRITPIRVQALFDGSPDSPKLSDHDGFRVLYRLSWTGAAAPLSACGPAPRRD